MDRILFTTQYRTNPDGKNRNRTVFRVDLGDCLFRMNSIDDAGDQYLTAMRLSPDNYIIYRKMGRYLLAKKEPKKAREMFEKALELNPNDRISRQILFKMNTAPINVNMQDLMLMGAGR